MALAFPPQIRMSDIGVMAAGEVASPQRKEIIALHKSSKNLSLKGKVQRDNSNVIEVSKRQTQVFVIHEDFDWVDRIIMDLAIQANKQFQFNITGLIERPQLLRYSSPSKGFDWHMDIGSGDHSTRKISVSIILNDDYDGGDLFFFQDGPQSVSPDAGVAVAFPSFLPHKVAPVTRGTRWSLVCWIAGEPFR